MRVSYAADNDTQGFHMFGTLIESRAQRPRRTGGSLASIIVHGVLVTAAILATAHQSRSAVREPPETIIVDYLTPPSRPLVRPVTVTAATPDISTLLSLPSIRVPTLTPTEIPAIDSSLAPTPVDFGERRVSSRSVGCDPPCAVTSPGDGNTAPMWAASDVIMQLRDAPVPPRFPERLRQAGVSGTVLVKFVVDTLGKVDMSSIEVLRSTHELFTNAVRETLGRMRFNPATSGNHKVPALAMMPFQFTLR